MPKGEDCQRRVLPTGAYLPNGAGSSTGETAGPTMYSAPISSHFQGPAMSGRSRSFCAVRRLAVRAVCALRHSDVGAS